jgi:glutamate-1-semialdehyde 2,1-aminomutase
VVFRKPHPFYAASASGCYVTDISGVTRVDFANNMASLIHGHAHPALVTAACEQIARGTAYTVGTEAEVRLAQHLCERVSGFGKIRFVNSGTEAVMAVIKAARAFTGRPKIAKAEGGYHGSYDFAEVSQSAGPSNWGDPDRPNSVPNVFGTPPGVLNDVVVYPFNDIERTITILNRQADQIACVLVDPVPHRIGFLPAAEHFISALHEWTRRNGALLAFDEVISFRIDHAGAQAQYPAKPDLTALGKIIGGGFPVGAFAGRDDVMERLDPRQTPLRFPLSGTFSANPVSMAAGLAAMELFDRQVVEQLNSLTRTAMKQIAEAATTAGVPVCLTGAGSLFKIHFRSDTPTTYRESYEDEGARKVVNAFIERLHEKGVIIVNSCSCVLSTVMTQKEVDILSEAALSGFRHVKPMLEK